MRLNIPTFQFNTLTPPFANTMLAVVFYSLNQLIVFSITIFQPSI